MMGGLRADDIRPYNALNVRVNMLGDVGDAVPYK